MAFEKYKEHVALLSKLRGIDNPILEEQLGIERLIFSTPGVHEQQHVPATDMNRAGRLFIQDAATHFSSRIMRPDAWCNVLYYGEPFRTRAADFFVGLWGDFSPEKRVLLWSIHQFSRVDITWKPGYFDKAPT